MTTPILIIILCLKIVINAQNILVDTMFGTAVSRKMLNGETMYRFFNQINVPDTKRVVNKPKNSNYKPLTVDWVSVVSACRATCRFDKRLCNFYIRAAAHDAFAIAGNYGGMDGSLVLTEDELRRQENNYDSFAIRLSKNYLAISKMFNASVADTIAVCGAVAVEFVGGPQIIKYNTRHPFMIGRYDNDEEPNPRTLAKAKMNTSEFVKFTRQRGLTVEEMTALMGTHLLLDEKGCVKNDGSLCDPNKERCENLEMYTWSNKYYTETCYFKTKIYEKAIEVKKTTTRDFDRKAEKCRFTSELFRKEAIEDFDRETADTEEETTEYINVEYSPKRYGVPKWPYTVHDAFMGKACQGMPTNFEVRDAMNKFKTDTKSWNSVFETAYKKMVDINARWTNMNGIPITGKECPSGYISVNKSIDCINCEFKPAYNGGLGNLFFKKNCDSSCKCKTELSDTAKFYENIIN